MFVVQCLARFMTPTDILEEVKKEFGIEMGREHVRAYNPTQRSDVAEKWKVLFNTERAKFIADVSTIGIAHQPYRLAELQKLYHATKSPGLKRELLEQAAKEVGGAFTNRRELSGQGGAPIQVETRVNRQDWAEEQVKRFMKEFKLTRKAAIEKLRTGAPKVIEYLGAVG